MSWLAQLFINIWLRIELARAERRANELYARDNDERTLH